MNTLRTLLLGSAAVLMAAADAPLSGKSGSNAKDPGNFARRTGGDEMLPATDYDPAKLAAGEKRRVNFIVHKEGVPDTVELSPSGRIITETHELPDWMPDGAYMADLAERNNFYQTRLGADTAERAGLGGNIINVDDLAWLCIDPEGSGVDETVVPASTEHRNAVLMKLLGVDDEGKIEGAVVDHYIAQDGRGYTLEELEAQKRTEQAAFGGATQQKKSAEGQQ